MPTQDTRAAVRSAAVDADETFGGTWPFEARYSEAPGFSMRYVDEGSGPETPLLLRGEPTWGCEFVGKDDRTGIAS